MAKHSGWFGAAMVLLAVTATSSVFARVEPPFDAPTKAFIYGSDDRRVVSNTSTFPWSAIGQVQISLGSGYYIGTGVMIGRYLALTCGHVAADPANGKPLSIFFAPGQTRYARPFGRIKVTEVIPAPQWKAHQSDGYDLAILVLAEPVGDQTGYFKIAVQPKSFFDNLSVEAAGYPTDLGGMDMYTISGVTGGMDGNLLFHFLDTEPGQSGSPFWYGDPAKGEARLVALNEGSYLTMTGDGTIERGIAARIDQSVANWIDEQLAAHNDVSQDISAPVDPASQVQSGTSFCGTGLSPFLVLGIAGWGSCLVARRCRHGG